MGIGDRTVCPSVTKGTDWSHWISADPRTSCKSATCIMWFKVGQPFLWTPFLQSKTPLPPKCLKTAISVDFMTDLYFWLRKTKSKFHATVLWISFPSQQASSFLDSVGSENFIALRMLGWPSVPLQLEWANTDQGARSYQLDVSGSKGGNHQKV